MVRPLKRLILSVYDGRTWDASLQTDTSVAISTQS